MAIFTWRFSSSILSLLRTQVMFPMLDARSSFLCSFKESTFFCLSFVSLEEVLEYLLPPVPNILWESLEYLLKLSKGIGRLGEGIPGFSKVGALFHGLM